MINSNTQSLCGRAGPSNSNQQVRFTMGFTTPAHDWASGSGLPGYLSRLGGQAAETDFFHGPRSGLPSLSMRRWPCPSRLLPAAHRSTGLEPTTRNQFVGIASGRGAWPANKTTKQSIVALSRETHARYLERRRRADDLKIWLIRELRAASRMQTHEASRSDPPV
jgi:hypothetical protein